MVLLKVSCRYEAWKGDKIAIAFNVQFKDMSDWMCIDSGTNKLILMNNSGWNSYTHVVDEFLRTASEGGQLAIEGRGSIGVCRDATFPERISKFNPG